MIKGFLYSLLVPIAVLGVFLYISTFHSTSDMSGWVFVVGILYALISAAISIPVGMYLGYKASVRIKK